MIIHQASGRLDAPRRLRGAQRLDETIRQQVWRRLCGLLFGPGGYRGHAQGSMFGGRDTHPNAKGYAVMASVVEIAIENALK